ncbi:MAG: putative ABC transporter permease [Anaerovoracaceae bacterium]|jgi:uncharacterized membrane protein
MIAGLTYYQICMFFLLYSFLGWVVEVVYHAVTLGKIVNRGFLNGPICPVYGFGMLAVLAAGNAVSMHADAQADVTQMNALLLFVFGFVLSTVVELIAGWALDRLFHARWWDYSNKPMNLNGYICPEFSIIWGLAIVLVVKVVHPMLSDSTAGSIPTEYGWPIMAVLYVLYAGDLIVTVSTASGLNKKLKELDRVRQLMRAPSDKLTDFLANTSISTAQHVQEGQVQASLAKTEFTERAQDAREQLELKSVEAKAKREHEVEEYRRRLEERAEELMADLSGHAAFGTGRLLRAFPTLSHEQYGDLVEELKKRIREKKEKKD